MAIFKKNPNEAEYYEGKKHFIDVIKNTGSGQNMIWRQPEEDFNTKSKLIVMPGEMAIFVDGGNVVQTFEEGTYELNTNNYPFISRLKNSLSGGISTFNCVVFFFRKADSEELKWGTDTPIQVRDKVYGIRTSVKARGTYKYRIENPSLVIEKMVGNNIRFQEMSDIEKYFKNEMMTKVKSTVASFLNSYQNEFIGIEAYLDSISSQVQPQINQSFEEYGLYCSNFSIAALNVDTTKYDDIDEAQVASVKRAKEAAGEKAYFDTLGQNWDKMQNAEIMKTLAANQSAGGIGTMGAGLGMGMAAAGAFGKMTNQLINGQMLNMGLDGQTASANNVQDNASNQDPMEILTKLKKMLDAGLIEQSEYDTKKAEILSRL